MIITNGTYDILFQFNADHKLYVQKQSIVSILSKGSLIIVTRNVGHDIVIDWTTVTSPVVTSQAQLVALLRTYSTGGASAWTTFTFVDADLVDGLATWLLTKTVTAGAKITTHTVLTPAGAGFIVPYTYSTLTIVLDFGGLIAAGTWTLMVESV